MSNPGAKYILYYVGDNAIYTMSVIMRNTYKQYVRPVLEYGAIALLSAPKTTLEKIQLVQNKAIKIAYRLRGVPAHAKYIS